MNCGRGLHEKAALCQGKSFLAKDKAQYPVGLYCSTAASKSPVSRSTLQRARSMAYCAS
jgi:hypothetical protein